MKIYYLAPKPTLEPNNKKRLKGLGSLICLPIKEVNEHEVIDKIQDAEILLISPKAVQKLTSHFFSSLPNLKHLALLSSGYDWIDVASAVQNHVSVSHCIGANAVSVVEHTWGLILSLSKRITEFDRDLHVSKEKVSKQYEGIELQGKTIGILGTGHIGTLVAKIGKSFSMRVLAYNKHGQINEHFDQNTDIKTLLEESDVITIHLPLNRETMNFIDAKKLKHTKTGVIIINTARESIVDKNAIIQTLKNGKIFGYGVDVEKLEKNDPYLNIPNVIVNIHNAFNTKEAKQKMQNLAIDNIEAFIKGKSINLVNL